MAFFLLHGKVHGLEDSRGGGIGLLKGVTHLGDAAQAVGHHHQGDHHQDERLGGQMMGDQHQVRAE